jgi:hypothetical protein
LPGLNFPDHCCQVAYFEAQAIAEQCFFKDMPALAFAIVAGSTSEA